MGRPVLTIILGAECRDSAPESHYAAFAWFSPYLAMSVVSKALCGTDYAHHQDFSLSAERWRKRFVEMLNETHGAGWS